MTGLGRNRLREVARLVPAGSRVADIGTDHLRLPRLLLSSGHVEHCIATDLRPTRRTLERAPLLARESAGRFEFRRGDGLAPLRPADGIEVCVIAGLGARTVLRILRPEDRRRLAIRRVILQPQTEPARVRRWLHENGFEIDAEALIEEHGQFYPVISATRRARAASPGHETLTLEDLYEAGPCLVRSTAPQVRRFWMRELARWEDALRQAGGRPVEPEVQEGRDQAQRVLASLPASAL